MFLQFYGLNEQPFGVTPDPRFLYMGPAQQEAFSSLVYGIETGRGFMALIASPGLGKTTILLRLMERLRESARTAFLFQTHSNSEEFLRSLLTDLDIEPSGRDLGELQRQLGDVLIEEARAGKRIVVAIDEAQNLDDQILEMIRMLSNFETPDSKLLQIVLVGQPQLADKLASRQLEQLRQRVSIITHFPPLDGKDIAKYIDHRLRTAGYAGNGLFTAAALRLIVAQSKGIPRNVNNLCFQALSLGYAKNQKRIDDAILREVIADLNLESLGTAKPAAQEQRPPQKVVSAADSREELRIGTVPPPRPATFEPERIANDNTSALDAVNLSSGPTVGNLYPTLRTAGMVGRRIPAGRERQSKARPFLLFTLAMLLGYLWVGPGLKSGLDALEGIAGGAGLAPRNTEVTTTSLPAATGETPSGDRTSALGSRSTPNAEPLPASSSPEAPIPAASEAAAPSGEEAHAAPPRVHPNSSPTSWRPTTYAREALPAHDSGDPQATSRLVVESNVSGARITINGKSDPKWITPRLFSLASGTYVVSVASGAHTTWTKRVHLDEGQERWLLAELEDHDGGVFVVDTDPPGMQVFIDGKAFGPSRVETVLSPGWHVCEVIPGPGLQTLVHKFHLSPGEALTRKIRLDSPAASLR